jgi:putative transposase
VKFALIEAEKAQFPVRFVCRHLGVSPSGFYAWRRRRPSAREQSDTQLAALIAEVHEQSRGTYGALRVQADLAELGQQVGRRRIARLMRALGLESRRKRRFKATTDSNHTQPVADNVLDRQFAVSAPDRAWVGDITYVPTREGWLYLATLIDLFSRRVVGWAMSARIDAQLTLDALDMALAARSPAAGLVHHTDRGSQYASRDYRRALATRGLVCSMSRKGNCWDNAVAESFFASLKTELVHHRDFATRSEARSAIFEYIEVFFNRHRRHSTLGYVSPVNYEVAKSSALAA